MTQLDPTIQILSVLSATLGEEIGPVGSLIHSFLHLSDTWLPAILTRESNLYRNGYSSRRKSIAKLLAIHLCDTCTPRL